MDECTSKRRFTLTRQPIGELVYGPMGREYFYYIKCRYKMLKDFIDSITSYLCGKSNSCAAKIKYNHKATALIAASKMANKPRKVPKEFEAYYCLYCRKFHIGGALNLTTKKFFRILWFWFKKRNKKMFNIELTPAQFNLVKEKLEVNPQVLAHTEDNPNNGVFSTKQVTLGYSYNGLDSLSLSVLAKYGFAKLASESRIQQKVQDLIKQL